MDDFPIAPPIIVKDTPKPRRLTTLQEARDYSTRRCGSAGRRPGAKSGTASRR
jgi:hypothetical protein